MEVESYMPRSYYSPIFLEQWTRDSCCAMRAS
jgi:hypothetical protein